jgi:hypothetical protein
MGTLVGLVVANLVFAGITFLGLFYALALTDAGRKRLQRQQYFNPELIELALTILGSLGSVFFILWLIEHHYALLLPGILCGGLALARFARRAESWQAIAGGLAFSLGLVAAIWTFVRGAIAATAEVGRLLESIGFEYGSMAGAAVGVLLWIGIPLLTFRLLALERRRQILKHTQLMQNPKYQKLAEEKWQLQKRLRDIEESQSSYEH